MRIWTPKKKTRADDLKANKEENMLKHIGLALGLAFGEPDPRVVLGLIVPKSGTGVSDVT